MARVGGQRGAGSEERGRLGAKVLTYAATNSILTLRPSDLAARFNVAKVTDVFFGSSSRLTAALDVRIFAAIALLLNFFFLIRSPTFIAKARLSATTWTSSSNPSSLKKASKLLPRCLFLILAVLEIGIFSLQSQR